MTTPPELLEPGLDAHGDTLYRAALVAAGDGRGAEGLLRALAAELGAAPPTRPLDEPELLSRLVATARREAEREARRRKARERRVRQAAPQHNSFAPFALHRLTLEQRLALALHLLLGYDGERLARVLACTPPAARAALIGGARALGPAAGASLTDRFSGEQCDGVRELLADPVAGSRHSAAVRGHLAGCAPCRAFDQAWGVIMPAVEAALRGALREQTLPAPLRARMLALAAPGGLRHAPPWRVTRLALAPLGVLALIVAMVLPGFLRQPVSVVERQPGSPVDAQALLAKSLARHSAAPERSGVWRARYETLWFFNDEVYAPMRADIWLDSRNPARHRLQLTHRDGGAPYELQVGDGEERLAYALDAAYAPSLYGWLPPAARSDQPTLLEQDLDAAGQVLARDERLRSGPWSLPPAYLRQAQGAPDLRLLGRQRDGGRVVQIMSFSGVSPLGLPPDAPGATAERVTVLLALDSEDGLLRRATELSGPTGAAQTGRVTWRLVEEQRLTSNQQIHAVFDSEQAWTGIGDFSEGENATSADLALPLLGVRDVVDPVELLSLSGLPLWLPARPPVGAERALLVWSDPERQNSLLPTALIYLGDGRRLSLIFSSDQRVEGEGLAIGPWRVTLSAGRAQRYTATLARPGPAPALRRFGVVDPTASVLLDAVGFTRAELEELIASMAPFDLAALAAQDALFIKPPGKDPAARAALIAAALAYARAPGEGAWHLTSRWYSRQDPSVRETRLDPYHLPVYEGRPEVTAAQEWLAGAGAELAIYVERSDPADGAPVMGFYADEERLWSYLARTDALSSWPSALTPYAVRLPRLAGMALDLLSQPGELTMQPLPDGGSVVRHTANARSSPRYRDNIVNMSPAEPHLYDLQPSTITTELELDPSGEARAARVYAESASFGRSQTMVESYELLSREAVPLAEAPVALQERTPPPATFVREYPFVQQPVVATILRRNALNDILGWVGAPLYVPADGAAELLLAEEGAVAAPGPEVSFSGAARDVLSEAVARRLAVRLSYRVPAGEYTPASRDLTLVQGPAAPLRAFLSNMPAVPWNWSEPTGLTVAGREVQGWYGGAEGRNYLMFELDETLIIVDTRFATDEPALLALLAGLQAEIR